MSFLPSTLLVIATAPIAGRLTDRFGSRLLMTAGLILVAVALYIQSGITIRTGYGQLLPAFMVMGVGIGLTMAPMSTAAMNAVSVDKAGVASGLLSMSRMVGGTFGVAAIGALLQMLGRSRLEENLAGTGVSAVVRDRIVEELGSGAAGASAAHASDPSNAAHLARAAQEAFVYALSNSLLLSMAVAAAGAIVALALIRSSPEGARGSGAAERPADEAHERPAEAQAEAVGI